MARMSEKYLRLSEDWARAAYALVRAAQPSLDVAPSSVSLMLNVLIDHMVGGEVSKSIKASGSLFENHDIILPKVLETAEDLKTHAPIRSLIFQKLGESYLAALSNSDTFSFPDKFYDIDFSRPVPVRPQKTNQKLPKKVIDEWTKMTLSQMEVVGVSITDEFRTALEENMLMVVANFGHMTQKQFDDEENEPEIRKFLGTITGEPNVTVAQYMRNAI